jgi:hypothetical protein
MAKNAQDDGPNPPMIIGAPIPPPSREECMAWHAANGTLASFLMDIGEYRDYSSRRPAARDGDRGRER